MAKDLFLIVDAVACFNRPVPSSVQGTAFGCSWLRPVSLGFAKIFPSPAAWYL